MMSCYEDLLEYYRYSGVEKYLKASECFYDILIENKLNPVGSVGINVMFANAVQQLNAISEPCDAMHFMRVYFDLFAVTVKVKYMDTFEYTFYNAFLAGIFKDGK